MKKLLSRKSGFNKILFVWIALFLSVPFTSFSQNEVFNDSLSVEEVTNIKKVADNLQLSESDLQAFKERAKQKVVEFVTYIGIIADNQRKPEMRNMAVESAQKLFINCDSNIIETSSIKNGVLKTNRNSIRIYLGRLRMLEKIRVVIQNYDLVYISDFVKVKDNEYKAVATYYQLYTAYADDRKVYRDETKKQVEVLLLHIEDVFYGEKRWVIRLGDIVVKETKLN